MKATSNYSFPFLKVVLASVLSFFLFSGNVSAQPSVKGRVTDQNGQPLPGVSVIVAGTTNGTMTGSDGSYVISVAKGQTLEFQCLGMTSFRKLCDGTVQVLNVTLKEDTAYLDEVVVVGYGTSKKSSLTGAVSAIKGDEVLKALRPRTSLRFLPAVFRASPLCRSPESLVRIRLPCVCAARSTESPTLWTDFR